MKKNERIVQFFDIGLTGETRTRDINQRLPSPRNIDELMREFIVLRDLNKARKPVSNRSKQEYRLEDMEERADCWVLMINVVDTDAAHPVTQKLDGTNDDREEVILGEDRGLESSSHLIILKQQTLAFKHLCLFEKSPSLPFSKAVSFLNHLCKESAKQHQDLYKLPHPSGVAGKTYNVFSVFTFLGHPSDEFRNELDEGVIKGIKITSSMEKIRGYDVDDHPDLIGTDIKMDVGRFAVMRSGGNWGHLQKAIDNANSLDSPFVRISFTDSTGAGHTAELSTDTCQISNAEKYIKKRKIEGFLGALKTAFPIIHEGIRDKMLEVINV